MVLLYTDGLLERPGVPSPTASVELAAVAADAAADRLLPAFSQSSLVDRVTEQTLERITRVTGSADDITVLAIRPIAAQPDLHLQVEAVRQHVPVLRRRVRDRLGPDRLAPEFLDQLDEVLTELCDNVVEHAYPPGAPKTLSVDVHLDAGGTLVLTVADRGTWATRSDAAGTGLGLAIATRLTERLDLERAPDGTTVTARLRPWKDSHGSRPRPPRTTSETFDVYTEQHEHGATTTVRGPVDVDDVDALDSELTLGVDVLDSELTLGTTPGAPPLTVDLQEVTLLSSAAIQTLLRRTAAAARAGVDVRIISAPGTVAQQVRTNWN